MDLLFWVTILNLVLIMAIVVTPVIGEIAVAYDKRKEKRKRRD